MTKSITLSTFIAGLTLALLLAPVALGGQAERGAMRAAQAHAAFQHRQAPTYALTGQTHRDYRAVKATADVRRHSDRIPGGRAN